MSKIRYVPDGVGFAHPQFRSVVRIRERKTLEANKIVETVLGEREARAIGKRVAPVAGGGVSKHTVELTYTTDTEQERFPAIR